MGDKTHSFIGGIVGGFAAIGVMQTYVLLLQYHHQQQFGEQFDVDTDDLLNGSAFK